MLHRHVSASRDHCLHVVYSVIVHLQLPTDDLRLRQDEEVDKFCVDLYQGTKLLGQKQVISKFSFHKRNVDSMKVEVSC